MPISTPVPVNTASLPKIQKVSTSAGYNHPGLVETFQYIEHIHKAKVLDLGAPSSVSFNFYRDRQCSVRFENVSGFLNDRIKEEESCNAENIIVDLEEYLSVLKGNECYDAILSWDIFCYLDKATRRYLSDKLSHHCHSRTRLHMVRYWNGQFPQTPLQFKIINGEQVNNNFSESSIRQHARLEPVSALHKTMPAFGLHKQYVQEDNMHPAVTDAVFIAISENIKFSDKPSREVEPPQEKKPHSIITQTTTKEKASINQRKQRLQSKANHQSTALPQLFNAKTLQKKKQDSINILDLAAHNEENARFYRYFSDKAIFANIHQLLASSSALTTTKLPALLPTRQTLKFDIIMGWDILCRCNQEETSAIMALLKPHLLPTTRMHLLRYVGNDPTYVLEQHEILSPKYLHLSGHSTVTQYPRLSIIQLISAIGFGTIEESSLFKQGMMPNINEYIVSFKTPY